MKIKPFFLFVIVLVIFSCQKAVKKSSNEEQKYCDTVPEKKMEMYQMTEMALLMEQMYVDNLRLKERILKNDTIGSFPIYFEKIHTAVMTDETDNDAFFKEQAAAYIKAQKLIYSDPKNAKKHFNNGVDACLKCHQQKCGGPIPRIKKLYIKV